MKKSTRASIAKDTVSILKKGIYKSPKGNTIKISSVLRNAMQKTKIYSPDESAALIDKLSEEGGEKATVFEVENERTLDAVNRLISEGRENVFCLNFASARHPGGGFLKGSEAQEESLARATGLYSCQLKGKSYYEINRNAETCLYTDYMIYSPHVPIIKNKEGELLEEVNTVSILTAPAVNAGVVLRQERHNVNKITPTMQNRIERVLAIAYEEGHRNLVLGAWGCGVFQNDPDNIAKMFYRSLHRRFQGLFDKVIFAVYSKDEKYITPFKARFDG